MTPTPMIAVSAHVYNEEVQSYLAAGFDGYLPKPLDKDALCVIVQNSLDGQELILEQVECYEGGVDSEMEQRVIIDSKIINADMEVLGKEKMRDIGHLFNQGADEILTLLENTQDNNGVKQLAHKLKGSAGSMGLYALFDVCLIIEKDSAPLTCYINNKQTLVQLVQQSKQALKELLD
jgi:two-component system sensor histidine kinase TorS